MDTEEELTKVASDGLKGRGKMMFIILSMGLFGIGLAIYKIFKSMVCGKTK